MKRKLPLTFIVFVLSLIACTKHSSNTDSVLIRIENATSESFTNLSLNESDFGSIAGGDTSGYVRCKNVWPYPFANNLAINNRYIYFQCTVPMSCLVNGRYLMKVVSDTLPWRYQASFIKEQIYTYSNQVAIKQKKSGSYLQGQDQLQ